jgi:hypothetical protein
MDCSLSQDGIYKRERRANPKAEKQQRTALGILPTAAEVEIEGKEKALNRNRVKQHRLKKKTQEAFRDAQLQSLQDMMSCSSMSSTPNANGNDNNNGQLSLQSPIQQAMMQHQGMPELTMEQTGSFTSQQTEAMMASYTHQSQAASAGLAQLGEALAATWMCSTNSKTSSNNSKTRMLLASILTLVSWHTLVFIPKA